MDGSWTHEPGAAPPPTCAALPTSTCNGPMFSPTVTPEPTPAAPRIVALASSSHRLSVVSKTPWITLFLIASAFLWCYWTTLRTMAERWSTEPQYSHGFLVPVFALAVLILRRPRQLPPWQPCWWGVPVAAAAMLLRFLAAAMDHQPLDGISMLLMLTGVVLLVGGRGVLAWSWPALAFLAFMLPLPFTIEVALSHPLQRVATEITTFFLQMLGYPALAEGNIIAIGPHRLGVVEACSGLGMLMTFFALATAMALVIPAPLADRLVIVASAIPIAVLVNVLRITATGMAYYHLGNDSAAAHALMHDMAGWFMMPLALLFLWLEWKYLGWLLVPAPEEKRSPRFWPV